MKIVRMTDIIQSMILVAKYINQISLDAKDMMVTDWYRYSENKIVELKETAAKTGLDVVFTLDLFAFVSKYIIDASIQESDT